MGLTMNGAMDESVTRLFQGFAFLMGRVRQKLDDDYPELTEGVISLLWPHYLRPLPSMCVVEIAPEPDGLKHSDTVHQHTEVISAPVGDNRIRCRYRTTRPLTLHPASFEDGGTDAISQCLLGLAGLGIPGTAEHLDTPLSRFLGMLPALQVPGRTAEGVAQVVKMVTPDTTATVVPHHKRRVEVPELTLSTAGGFCLGDHLVLGGVATDVNGTIDIRLYTESKADLQGWFPPDFTLYNDLLALLRVYLGWRYDAHISLTFPRRLLPRPRLTCQYSDDSVYMGYSCLLGQDPDDMTPDPAMPDRLTVSLGYYEGLQKNPQHREVTDVEE